MSKLEPWQELVEAVVLRAMAYLDNARERSRRGDKRQALVELKWAFRVIAHGLREIGR